MELDRLAAAVRPRRPWEGLDLGFTLGRTWFRTLWPLWWISVLPLGVLAWALVGGRSDRWLLAVWWLKPLYEAPLVYWTSRALFGERLPLSAAPSILRASWTRRLLPFLLWRRLSPSRSFSMPVALLEGLSGKAARQRRRILSGGSAAPAWLTIVCYHFEAILWGGLLIALFLLVPEGLPRLDLQAAFTDSGSWPYWLSGMLYLLAFSTIAPFYVCAGFALYLTRRTELEAWDLELAFRQVEPAVPGQRRERPAAPGLPMALAAGTLALALLTPAPGAAPKAAELPDPERARALIGEVLKDPAFGQTREISVWVPIAKPRQEQAPETPAWPSWLSALAVAVGTFLKWLLLALAVAALALLARRIARDWQPPRRRPRRARAPGPASQPMALEQEPDPAELAALVRARLAAGDPRGALALLYRGGLAWLARRGAQVPKGVTEGEALRLAAGHLGPRELPAFRHLTRDWQALAYAHRVPQGPAIAGRLEEWLKATADSPETPADAGQGERHGG